jgi:hypothetical protein
MALSFMGILKNRVTVRLESDVIDQLFHYVCDKNGIKMTIIMV